MRDYDKNHSIRSPMALATGIVLMLLMVPLVLHAQYFGRNKVQYEDFDFKVMKTENFDIYYYPPETEATKDAARMAERWRSRIATVFDHSLTEHQPLILYANHPDFQQTNVISGQISQGTGGVTEGMKNRVVLPFTGSYADDDHVIGHELVHAFQYDIMRRDAGNAYAAQGVPLWFIEGMSEYLSIGREDPLTAMWLRDAVLNDNVPTIKQMSNSGKYFPYRWGHAMWTYLTGNYGDDAVPTLFHDVMATNFRTGLTALAGTTLDTLSMRWQKSIRDTYGPQVEGKQKPSEVGERITAGEEAIHLSPSLSPDGMYVAFLSNRDLFTIDLYLADAQTGEIKSKLVSSNTDAHFDALRFMDASGAWSPDGSQFAFITQKNGDNGFAIVDVPDGDIRKNVAVDGISAITSLAWSPDGRRIAISGIAGGIGDLFLYDLQNGEVTRLTNDRYAELQPAWSPDGGTIAFVTDRGPDTNLERLEMGAMKIALFDVRNREYQLIHIGDATKHINPQFSPDGSELFLVADPDGISNVYRYDIDSGRSWKLTDLATGVSGLTEMSPALTMSANTGRLIFTVFDNTEYHLQALTLDQAHEKPFKPQMAGVSGNIALPPVEEAGEGTVNAYLMQPEAGLPMQRDFPVEKYDADLTLTSVRQAGAGVGVSSYGMSMVGGVYFNFTDMLANHNLNVGIQANGGVKDIGGQLIYINRGGRLNWGLGFQHIPYRTGRTFYGIDSVNVDGEQVAALRSGILRQRVFYDRVPFLMEYPLSTNRRLEMSTGFTRISYDVESDSYLQTENGRIIDEGTRDLESPDGLNLFQSSFAYVGDYSFYGMASPVNGRAFRFEVEPTFGSLNYMSFLADFRQYFFINPFTLAFRGMHYGRYLEDAESNRLPPLYLGYDNYVRGYDIQSMDVGECTITEDGTCAEIDRLIGSRIAVFNAEFRVPVFGNSQFGLVNFPYIPLEFSWFLDGGVAWTQDESPTWELTEKSSERIPVFSTGPNARISLGRYAVLQFYYARPFQRPDKDWQFGFNISPGW